MTSLFPSPWFFAGYIAFDWIALEDLKGCWQSDIQNQKKSFSSSFKLCLLVQKVFDSWLFKFSLVQRAVKWIFVILVSKIHARKFAPTNTFLLSSTHIPTLQYKKWACFWLLATVVTIIIRHEHVQILKIRNSYEKIFASAFTNVQDLCSNSLLRVDRWIGEFRVEESSLCILNGQSPNIKMSTSAPLLSTK